MLNVQIVQQCQSEHELRDVGASSDEWRRFRKWTGKLAPVPVISAGRSSKLLSTRHFSASAGHIIFPSSYRASPYRSTTNNTMMATFTDHGNVNLQPVCQNCQTSTTPLWRRDEIGSVLCNACGLFLKLHGSPRPISLKTDVIKSRNRVKSTAQGQKRKVSMAQESTTGDTLLISLISHCSKAMGTRPPIQMPALINNRSTITVGPLRRPHRATQTILTRPSRAQARPQYTNLLTSPPNTCSMASP